MIVSILDIITLDIFMRSCQIKGMSLRKKKVYDNSLMFWSRLPTTEEMSPQEIKDSLYEGLDELVEIYNGLIEEDEIKYSKAKIFVRALQLGIAQMKKTKKTF